MATPTQTTQPTTGLGSTAQTNALLGGNYFDPNTGAAVKSFTPAPAVVSSKLGIDQATKIQGTLDQKTTDAQTMAAAKQNLTTTYDTQGNMVQTGGVLPNGTQYQNVIPKSSSNYVPNPADVKAAQDAQTAKTQANADTALATAANGVPSNTTLPTTPATQTLQTNLPSSVSIPYGIDPSTRDGQITWYNQNPTQFNQWAKDQGWNQENTSQLAYEASVQNANDTAVGIKSTLNQFLTGTYPLTQDQQDQINATQQQFDTLIAQQQVANQNYENGVRILGYTTGRAQYFPDIAMGEVQTAVNAGLQKVADLHSKEAQTLATMRQGFESDNFKMVESANNDLATIEKNITDSLKGVHDEIVAQKQQTFDNARNIAMDNWTQYVNQQNLDISQANQKLDQMKFTEQQKMDAQTILNDKIKNQIDEANLAINQAKFNLEYGSLGALTNPDGSKTPMKPTDIPGVKEIAPGVSYFDPTNINDPTLAKAAENAARKSGQIAIIDPKDAPNAEALTTALTNLQEAQDDFNKIATPNYFGSTFVHGAENLISGVGKNLGYVSQFQQNISAYNNARNTVIQLAGTMTGGNARALRAILDQLDTVLPTAPQPLGTGFMGTGIGARGASLTPTTQAEADAKFHSARKLMYGAIKTLVPNANLPASGDIKYGSLTDYFAAHPEMQALGQSLHNQGVDDQTILNKLNQ